MLLSWQWTGIQFLILILYPCSLKLFILFSSDYQMGIIERKRISYDVPLHINLSALVWYSVSLSLLLTLLVLLSPLSLSFLSQSIYHVYFNALVLFRWWFIYHLYSSHFNSQERLTFIIYTLSISISPLFTHVLEVNLKTISKLFSSISVSNFMREKNTFKFKIGNLVIDPDPVL